ncbi:argonaute-like protein [Cerioporus squamosus]|nr:argonaute-like protein [Cerioporus squamosus]
MPPRSSSTPAPEDRGRGASLGGGSRGGSRGVPRRGVSSPPSARGTTHGGPPSSIVPSAIFRGFPRGRARGIAGTPSVPARTGANNTGSGAPVAIAPPPQPATSTRALPDTSVHITTVGVKRTAFGRSGRVLNVYTNHFVTSIPDDNIFHYDGAIDSNKILPARLNMEIIKWLQTVIAPEVFTPRVVYDGRKNVFASRRLPLGPTDTREFSFSLADAPALQATEGGSEPRSEPRRGPRVYTVRLALANTINPEVLRRFVAGKQSHDNDVLTGITALNVVMRMQPSLHYPSNSRSFFTNRETKDIGGGIVLWRGYFQSVRPAIGRMLINVDITTGFMYKPGSMLDLALDFLGGPRNPNRLAPNRGFPERERLRLQRFFSGLRVLVHLPEQAHSGPASRNPRPVAKLTTAGASQLSFKNRKGVTFTVAQYFQSVHNVTLRFPDIVCVQFASGAQVPMECCFIPEGQFMRKQVPPEKVKDVLSFAAKNPTERLNSIREGLQTLAYGQSEYVRDFGMHVEENAGRPLEVKARVLQAPTLRYHETSKQPTITPRDGEWNMIDKKFYRPMTIKRWIVVIYERQQRYRMQDAQDLVSNFLLTFAGVGMQVEESDPIISYQDPSGSIENQLRGIGRQCLQKHRGQGGPQLIVVVLPATAGDIYHAVKHFGDITQGVATQCLNTLKCKGARHQYYANVCLKINVKMGGINVVPEARSVPALTDPHNPTIIMGADVMHPAPGSQGRPSFTSLVASVDSDNSRYVAECRAQTGRVEMIEDLKDMVENVLKLYKDYRADKEKKPFNPQRIIFFRDGVSEGEFRQVLQRELPQLQAACATLGIQPKITMLVVGKRHHVRFFPMRQSEADPSGNCPAGTVVDSDITHPTEFDFYLQSRQAPAGPTSRSAHYSVLYDENKFTPDSLQALSYALCHVYARATRSVSIPAPVYYAGIVCARGKLHYVPGGQDLSDSTTQLSPAEAEHQLEAFRSEFKPVHKNTRYMMYFS